MSAVYAAVEAIVQAADFPTAAVCAVLNVCRSAYYAWRAGESSVREQREAALTPPAPSGYWSKKQTAGRPGDKPTA